MISGLLWDVCSKLTQRPFAASNTEEQTVTLAVPKMQNVKTYFLKSYFLLGGDWLCVKGNRQKWCNRNTILFPSFTPVATLGS